MWCHRRLLQQLQHQTSGIYRFGDDLICSLRILSTVLKLGVLSMARSKMSSTLCRTYIMFTVTVARGPLIVHPLLRSLSLFEKGCTLTRTLRKFYLLILLSKMKCGWQFRFRWAPNGLNFMYCKVKLKDHNNGSLSVMKFICWSATNETDPLMAMDMRAEKKNPLFFFFSLQQTKLIPKPVVEEYTHSHSTIGNFSSQRKKKQ